MLGYNGKYCKSLLDLCELILLTEVGETMTMWKMSYMRAGKKEIKRLVCNAASMWCAMLRSIA